MVRSPRNSTKTLVLGLSALIAGNAGAAAQGTPFPEEPIDIAIAWWGGNYRNKLHDAVIDLFIKAHPNVSVERQSADFDPYWDRLSVQAAGGNVPDQIQMQIRFLQQFGRGGRTLKPLDGYVEDGTIDLSGVPDFLIGAGTYKDQLLMVPTSFSFRGLMFDRAALEAAGVEPPTLDTTWEEYAALLRQLAEADLPEGVWPAHNECEDDSTFYAYVRSHGAQAYNEDGTDLGFDSDLAVQYFKYWNDLQNAGALIPPDVRSANAGTSAQDSVLAKRLVLMQAHPANQFESLNEIIEAADMTALPKGPNGAGDAFIVSGQSISATVDDAHARVAAEYIDFFLNDPEASAAYQGDNGIPASEVGREAIAAKNLEQVALFEQIVDTVPPFPPLPPGYAKVRDALLRACDQVAFGQLSVEEGANQFVAEARASLAQ